MNDPAATPSLFKPMAISALLATVLGLLAGLLVFHGPTQATAEPTKPPGTGTTATGDFVSMDDLGGEKSFEVPDGTLPRALDECLPDAPPGMVYSHDSPILKRCLSLGTPTTKRNRIGSSSVPGQLLKLCRTDAEAVPDCGLVLAISGGLVAPGRYTDDELVAAVAEAGYDWEPAK